MSSKSMGFRGWTARIWGDPRCRLAATVIHEERFGLSVPRPGVTASTDEAGLAATAAVTRAATRYLDEARRVLARGDVDGAWRSVQRARECQVAIWTPGEIDVAVITLRSALTQRDRLPTWRRSAALDLLNKLSKEPAAQRALAVVEQDRLVLAQAMRIHSDGISNEYQRLRIARHYQAMLLIFGVPILLATVVLLAWSAPHLNQPSWQGSCWPCLLSTLLGGLGALTSAAQRSTKVVSSRIPELLGSSVASLSRIPIGMVAGVSIWLLSRAAVGADAAHATDMLLAAFAAGFAERLLVQSTTPAGSGTDPDAHARNPT